VTDQLADVTLGKRRPAPAPTGEAAPKKFSYHRHSALVRATHWINVACIVLLLMSGMAIFNAHPALYAGAQSDFADPLLNLGVSSPDAKVLSRPFPSWLTGGLELANGRRWHLFVIWVFILNGLVYFLASLLDEHIWHDLLPHRWQLKLGEVAKTIRHHLRLTFPHQHDYNVLQKFVYLAMIFVILPGIILTGLSMSPGIDAIAPWLGNIFGGRQSARTFHFVFATLVVLFIVVHVGLVILSGFWNNMRSMITGEYEIDPEEEAPDGRP
jgi:thiosulfate reductase cytochrome b subunit